MAKKLELHVVSAEVLQLTFNEVAQQANERADLRLGAIPVLRTKGIKGKVFYSVVGEPLNNSSNVLRARPVSG